MRPYDLAFGMALLVGGALDGTRLPVFTVPDHADQYRLEVVATPAGDVHYWVAEALSRADLLDRLMTSSHHWKELD